MAQPIIGVLLAGGRSSRMGREKPLLEIGGKPLIERVRDALAPAVSEILLVTNRPDLYGFLGLTTIPDLVVGRGPLAGIHAALTRLERGTALVVAADYPFLEPSALARIAKEASGIERTEDRFRGQIPGITSEEGGTGKGIRASASAESGAGGGAAGPPRDAGGIGADGSEISRERFTTTTPVPGAPNEAPRGSVVLPQIEGRLHPLCALYTASAVDEVAATLAAGELMVLSLVARLEQKVLGQKEFGPDAARIFFNINTPDDLRRAEEMLEQTQPRG